EVVIQDPRAGEPDEYDDPPGFWAPELQKLISTIWTMVREDGTDAPLSPPIQTSVGGENAYEIPVTRGVGWNGFGRAVDEETLWIFVSHDNLKFEIIVPNQPPFF